MIYARINVNVDTGVYLFLHISCGTEYSQHSNALAHPNPSANSNKFKLLPYHCYAKGFRLFYFFAVVDGLLIANHRFGFLWSRSITFSVFSQLAFC